MFETPTRLTIKLLENMTIMDLLLHPTSESISNCMNGSKVFAM